MKQNNLIKRVFIAIAMTLTVSVFASAHEFEVDGIYYNISSSTNKTCEVTFKGTDEYENDYAGDIVIPETVTHEGTTYSVTGIGNAAFSYCGLTSIIIPEGVTSIGSSAFYGCCLLTSVTIPNSVTSIGEHAFVCCEGLTELEILGNETRIGYSAFRDCYGLKSVIIHGGVIEGDMFSNSGHSGMSITLGSNVVDVFESVFNAYFKKIVCKAITPPFIIPDMGGDLMKSLTIYVPKGCKETYKNADYWNLCKEIIEIESNESAESITLDNTSVSLEINETVTLLATILPETATNKEVVWTSSDESIATVEKGIVTALKVGVATITATTTDGTDLSSSCEVTVMPTIAKSITLDNTSVMLEINETVTLLATILPETATNKEVVWTSSDESVATVEKGVVTALKVGVATITATTTDGTDLNASCEVTVKSISCEFVAEEIKTLHGRVVELPVCLVNDREISAFQFDVYLPEGITIAIDEDDEYEMTLSSDRATSSHTVSTFKQSNGAIRYACYSTKSAAFKGESGTVLFTIPLTIAKDIEGEFNVQIKDIILSSPTAQGYNNPDLNIVVTVEKYELGDSNGDGIINVLDIVTTVNATLGVSSENIIANAADVNGDGVINVLDIVATVNLVLNNTAKSQLNVNNYSLQAKALTDTQGCDNIFINDFTINASESKTIEVNMNNIDSFCAFQFDMYLPEGLTIDEEDEEFLIEATSRLTKSHMISTNKLSENVIRFVVYSNKNSSIKSNEGAIMTIPFIASAEMETGSYQIEIKDVILSYNTGAGVYTSNTTTNVNVFSLTGIGTEEIVNDNIDVEYYNLQGVKVVNPSNGLYIKKEGNKVTKIYIK